MDACRGRSSLVSGTSNPHREEDGLYLYPGQDGGNVKVHNSVEECHAWRRSPNVYGGLVVSCVSQACASSTAACTDHLEGLGLGGVLAALGEFLQRPLAGLLRKLLHNTCQKAHKSSLQSRREPTMILLAGKAADRIAGVPVGGNLS